MSAVSTYSRDAIEFLHSLIPHGQKKIIAAQLGLHPAALSRYLNPYKGRYQMPETVYTRIVNIIINPPQNGTGSSNHPL